MERRFWLLGAPKGRQAAGKAGREADWGQQEEGEEEEEEGGKGARREEARCIQ